MNRRPKITFSMIARNEEAVLKRCLSSVADLVDEIILVDTGSTDLTKHIGENFGAKVVDCPWSQDFSKARNVGIEHASGDWILWIDADEYFDEENRTKLRELISKLPDANLVYMMQQVNTLEDHPGEEVVFSRPSLFRNRPDIRWKYRVHEQILSTIQAVGGRMVNTDIRIMHTGYYNHKVHEEKVLRNIRLLHQDEAEYPDDPFVLFHLGLMYQSVKRSAEAIPYWPKAIKYFMPNHSMVPKCYYLWIQGLVQLGMLEKANRVSVEVAKRFPDHSELKIQRASLLAAIGNIQEAERLLHELVKGQQKQKIEVLASYNLGILTFIPYQMLGDLYQKTGRLQEAEAAYRRALSYNPSFQPAIEGLNKVLGLK